MSLNKKELRRLLLEARELGKKAEKTLATSDSFATFVEKCYTNKTTPKLLKDIDRLGESMHQLITLLETSKDPEPEKGSASAHPIVPKKSNPTLQIQEVKEAKEVKEPWNEHLDLLAKFTGQILANMKAPQKGGAKKRIPAALRKQVWNNYIGAAKGQALCLVCKHNTIDKLGFEAGHVVPECLGGPTTLENLRPICGDCNRSMGSQHMNSYSMQYYGHGV
jgi:hypothetical protein